MEYLPELVDTINQLSTLLTNTTVSSAVCGSSRLNIFSFAQTFGGLFNTTKSKRSYQSSINMDKISYLVDLNDGFCHAIIDLIGSNSAATFIFNAIYPILYGKILYSPNTPVYDEIIKKMNSTFMTIDQFVNSDSNLDSIRAQLDIYEAIFSKFLSIDFTQIRQNLDELSTVITFLKKLISCFSIDRFIGYSNENDALNDAIKFALSNSIWALIVFDQNLNITTELPDQITYKIRMNAYNTHDTTSFKDKTYKYDPNNCLRCTVDFNLGYIYIQDLLEKSIIEVKTNESYEYDIVSQMTPYPCYIQDVFVESITQILPLVMVLAWIFTVSMIIKDIVYEKEKRLKEFMRVMGLTNGIHWVAWFITSFTVTMVICILLSVILKYGKITGHTDLGVLIVFLCCFMMATITQSFLISVFFVRANLAAAAGGIIYFLLYLPYTILINYSAVTQQYQIGLVSLISTVAFSYGCNIIGLYEQEGVGVNWSNFYESPITSQNGITMNFFCLAMLLDSLIYMFLAWYIETVWPGEFGTGRSFYFLFQPSFWCETFASNHRLTCKSNLKLEKIRKIIDDNKKKRLKEGDEGSQDDNIIIREPFDLSNQNGKIGVEIKDLHKVYSRGKNYALKGLTVNFYENEITSFLGLVFILFK